MKKIYFPLLVFFIYLFFVFNQIHSSSIGMYHQFFYGSKKDHNLIFGQPRPIRSDEWLVGTPKVIGQVKAGFPVINKNIGFGEAMPVQGCLPYKHWRLVFCPNMWPFFFLPLENAFSAAWWFPTLLMMIAIYYFVFFLTQSIFVAITSSVIFFFTPFNQWWTYLLSSFLGYGLLFILFFIKAIEKNKDKIRSMIYFILSAYFLINYAFILYPPFQVASFYVFGLLLFGILIQKKLFNKKSIALGLTMLIFSVFPIIGFYHEFKPTIDIVRNTVYPGKRFVSNSLGNFLHLINGFYNTQLLDDVKGSGPFANQSEASNFFLISFFCLPVYLWVLIEEIKKKKVDWIFFTLISSFIILLIWFLFPFPSLVAKLSLLFLVPQKRALIGIGIANYLLAIYFLAKIKVSKDRFYSYLKWLSVMIIFLTNLYLGFFLKYNYPVFIQNNIKIFLLSVISGLLLYLLLSQHKKLFLIVLLIFSFISSYRVNPLYQRLEILFNNPVSTLLQKTKADKKASVAILNEREIIGLPYVLDKKSLSGIYYHPQLSLWEIFDEKKKYNQIYNRYSHIIFINNSNKRKNSFILNHPDFFIFNINFCQSLSLIKKVNLKWLISNEPLNDYCFQLKEKIKSLNKNYYLYEIIYN